MKKYLLSLFRKNEDQCVIDYVLEAINNALAEEKVLPGMADREELTNTILDYIPQWNPELTERLLTNWDEGHHAKPKVAAVEKKSEDAAKKAEKSSPIEQSKVKENSPEKNPEKAPEKEREKKKVDVPNEEEKGLLEMFPHLRLKTIRSALSQARGDVTRAVDILIQSPESEESSEEESTEDTNNISGAVSVPIESREEKMKRRALVERFGYRPDSGPSNPKISIDKKEKGKKSGSEKVHKYVNNVPVLVKANEKFIVEKEQESEKMQETYIKIAVITKGKRGK